ncbi:hypothetical protein GC207_13565 [bacterium]|nr:hypothetical protein [bacterium]
MPKQVRLRRGTTAQHATFAGALGEVTFDTDKKTLVCHDGATAGGFPLSLDGPASVPTGSLLWVDAINGNDTTGLRGDAGFPFLTLTAAKDAAAYGDTIIVRPGTYNERNLLKTGVNWHFITGAKVVNSAAASGAIFDDGINGANSNIICRITGDGEFINNSTDALSWAIVVSKSGSYVSIDAQFIGAGSKGCVRCTNGNTRIHVSTINSGGPRAVELYGGTNFLRADEIKSTGGNGVELGGGSNTVEAGSITSEAGVGMRCIAGTNDVAAREIKSSAGYGLHHQFVEDPFTLTVNGARIVSTLVAAGGRAVQADGSDDLTLKDCVLVSSAAAATSIDAGTATNVRLYGSTMANKSAGANITFLTGGGRFEVDANVR